jgi:hypothetical protein
VLGIALSLTWILDRLPAYFEELLLIVKSRGMFEI